MNASSTVAVVAQKDERRKRKRTESVQRGRAGSSPKPPSKKPLVMQKSLHCKNPETCTCLVDRRCCCRKTNATEKESGTGSVQRGRRDAGRLATTSAEGDPQSARRRNRGRRHCGVVANRRRTRSRRRVGAVEHIDTNHGGVPTFAIRYTHYRWYNAAGTPYDFPLNAKQLDGDGVCPLPPDAGVEVFDVTKTTRFPPPPPSPPPHTSVPRSQMYCLCNQ